MLLRRIIPLVLVAATSALVPPLPVLAQDAPKLDDARRLWQTGKYEEALEAYNAIARELAEEDDAGRSQLAIGRAAALASTGKTSEAIEVLKSAVADAEEASLQADALAQLAEVEFARGLWDDARSHAEAALEAEPDHLLGRWVQARLFEAVGEPEKADWRWFIEMYNARRGEIEQDADALVLIGQAAEKYYWANARGENLASGLNDVINQIYEAALQVDERCWQAAWREGLLFLNGYREGDARKELNRALLINPSAVEVIVALGRADLQGYKLADGRRKVEDAIEINPSYGPAYTLLADLNISDERFEDALEAAENAVAQNPKDEEALGRLAAAHRLLINPIGTAAAEAKALAINAKPATFYAALGERLADRRKYHSAERAFLQAIAADPERADSRIGLGMLYMQIGREPEAQALFTAAFEADPFNVRADNMMKVLKRLAGYETIETEHFRVLVKPDQDELLGKYMAEFLELAYPDLVERFGYATPGKTTIEIMEDHQWFSGRTTALPFIPTVGACTGKVVALASPKTTKQPFNWSRVMVHEVTHVITLQQTDFNIPHWYTEALAVESEGTPRPQEWNKMLLKRVPARKLLNLDNINLGFIRPDQPEDRQMAYCQAQLYARYMLKRFGDDALIKMLAAYRRGLTTEKAIAACFEVDKQDFEAGYLEYLDEVIQTIRTRVEDEEETFTFTQIQQQLKAKPDDPDLNARMAYEHFARRDLRAARPFADKALEHRENHPLASYVKARLLVSIGDSGSALEVLRPALDPDHPNERVVDLLAELEMKDGNLDEAARLYELARQDDPHHSKWIAGLARVHLRQGDREALLNDLAMLADNDADDLDVRRTLADQHLARGDFEESARWATECLYIDVYAPDLHVTLADAHAGLKDFDKAIEEYRVALTLEPKEPADIQVKLAKALNESGQADEAKATLEVILKDDPGHPEAKALRAELEPAGGGGS